MTVFLLVVAALFAIVAGANDGSAIVAASLRVTGMRPLTSLGILLTALVVGPLLLFGTGVATTLVHGLVPFGGRDADMVLAVAALSALAVVFGLSRAGLPTSLTLALVGAIAGAGLGAGLSVDSSTLGIVLLAGVVAPVLSAGLGFGVSRLGLRGLRGFATTRRARGLHAVAFTLQCLAYSANGGQKMLAVFALATGTTAAGMVGVPWWLPIALAALFGIGVLTSLRRVSASLGSDILTVRLRHALVAETCSFVVIFGGGLVGLPLTMSQTVTGALIGAGVSESPRRVRWPAAVRMAGAWIVTLPASIGLAALAGAFTRWL